MTQLVVTDATVRHGTESDGTTAFAGLDLVVDPGEFVTVMGPSGCGKTSLLDAVAGLVDPEDGRIVLDGEPVAAGAMPLRYVFQEPRLLPWRTAAENVAFALKAADVPPTARERRVDAVLERVGLADQHATYPRQLSGGQRQRVNLARALATEPEILLLDEPFSSLDAVTARRIRRDLRNVWTDAGLSVLFVTHDMREAVALSDRVIFLDASGKRFASASIPHDRPRSFDDPAVRETEARLTRRFFDHVDGGY